jgi:hypothetical protein
LKGLDQSNTFFQIMNLSYLTIKFWFFYKWQCTQKLGFKNIFNEEYELYQPKETYEYIFSKYK